MTALLDVKTAKQDFKEHEKPWKKNTRNEYSNSSVTNLKQKRSGKCLTKTTKQRRSETWIGSSKN